MTKTETNTVKLTKDEIKELGDLRGSISNITLVIGETEIAFENLGIRKRELLSRLLKLSEKQNDIAKKQKINMVKEMLIQIPVNSFQYKGS